MRWDVSEVSPVTRDRFGKLKLFLLHVPLFEMYLK